MTGKDVRLCLKPPGAQQPAVLCHKICCHWGRIITDEIFQETNKRCIDFSARSDNFWEASWNSVVTGSLSEHPFSL